MESLYKINLKYQVFTIQRIQIISLCGHLHVYAYNYAIHSDEKTRPVWVSITAWMDTVACVQWSGR